MTKRTQGEAPQAEAAADPPADMQIAVDAARTEAHAAGVIAGKAEATDRIRSILTAPETEGREAQALVLALETEMKATDAAKVLASLASPVQLFRVNIEGTVNLFEAMARNGCTRMIHISSEEIYGEFLAPKIDESHREAPLHAYGISKSAVEHLGRSYRATHGLECINIRTSWVYGPGFPRDRVPVNMVRAAAAGRPCHVPGGAGERIDHTYLDDAVAGILGALDCAVHRYDAYHVASGSAPSIAEIAEVVRELVPGAEITLGSGPYRHGGTVAMPTKGALDCGRARAIFGYVPRHDIRAGLAAMLSAERVGHATQN